MNDLGWRIVISGLAFASVYLFVCHGWAATLVMLDRLERWYDRVLVQQLLLDIRPRTAVVASVGCILGCGFAAYYLMGSYPWFFVGVAAGVFVPSLVIRHLEQKRAERLESQLVDGITTLASGVRAGLNLVQAMELIATTASGPIRQEFAQLLREYQMGLDLNQAMRNAANRIGLRNYRLLFTAIEMHRLRGGDAGESLDRIAESIREIQRLQGKLDALTSQGRTQAWMMAAMPLLFLGILYTIDSEGVEMMFTQSVGRIMILIAMVLIGVGFVWIRKIMDVDM